MFSICIEYISVKMTKLRKKIFHQLPTKNGDLILNNAFKLYHFSDKIKLKTLIMVGIINVYSNLRETSAGCVIVIRFLVVSVIFDVFSV